jgi:hypothetical protein
MAETDHERLADDLEQQADDLERHSEELRQRAEDASQDWRRKRSDPNVPGAPAPDDGEDEHGEPPSGSARGEGHEESPADNGEDD